MAQHVMVIGSQQDSAPVIFALRDRGLQAWSDRIGRVALDFVSFDWADALVVIDRTPHVECEHLRPVTEFHGVKLLAASASLPPERRAALLDRGFDGMVSYSSPAEVIAAYVDRFLSRAVLPRRERLYA